MSCGCGKATFRLLDAYVGWDVGSTNNLVGFDDPDGIYLATLSPNVIDPGAVLPYLPPSQLAIGCGPCGWYLLTLPPDCPPSVLRLDRCCGDWKPVWHHCPSPSFKKPVAIAAWESRLAVADAGAGAVFVWGNYGQRLVASIEVKNPGPIAISACGDLFVASDDRVLRFGPGGAASGFVNMPAEPHGEIDRIATDGHCGLWVVTREAGGVALWHASTHELCLSAATLDQLQQAFTKTSLVAASNLGFCLAERDSLNFPVTRCFSWCGKPVDGGIVNPSIGRQKQGALLTLPLDSGIPRCRWHRVQLDADVPAGAAINVAVTTTEDPNALLHPDDWMPGPPGALDFLIDQPPGRYLLVQLTLIGDGTVTPVVRRVRLDFPRVTSLDRLPAIYRDNPDAEDFSERFLSLFDASMADLDRAIERYPALLNAQNVPDAVLPWLGRFFDIAMDPSWTTAQRRRILQAAPQLYRIRGTVAGMTKAISLVFDIDETNIAIDELAADRSWGAVDSARVGSVRLFGKARARFRLDASPLGSAPLRSFGNPDQDPFWAQAFRFQVMTPPIPDGADPGGVRLRALVDAQKPAQTLATIHTGGNAFLVGAGASVGVDTVLTAPPPAVVGSTRLGSPGILQTGATGCRDGVAAGRWTLGGNQVVRE